MSGQRGTSKRRHSIILDANLDLSREPLMEHYSSAEPSRSTNSIRGGIFRRDLRKRRNSPTVRGATTSKTRIKSERETREHHAAYTTEGLVILPFADSDLKMLIKGKRRKLRWDHRNKKEVCARPRAQTVNKTEDGDPKRSFIKGKDESRVKT